RVWPDPRTGAILPSWLPKMAPPCGGLPGDTVSEAPMSKFLTETEAMITTWHGIAVPNDPARRLAAELADTIAAFEKLRGTLVFEDEPASFEAALQATKETAA